MFAVEERQLVDLLISCAEFGSPLTMYDMRMIIIKDILDANGVRIKRFTNNMPGVEWCVSFISRHFHRLTKRQCQNIIRSRAAKDENEIDTYFENSEKSLEGIPQESILNYDETNLSDDPGSRKCVFRRGTKYSERVLNSTKTSIS